MMPDDQLETNSLPELKSLKSEHARAFYTQLLTKLFGLSVVSEGLTETDKTLPRPIYFPFQVRETGSGVSIESQSMQFPFEKRAFDQMMVGVNEIVLRSFCFVKLTRVEEYFGLLQRTIGLDPVFSQMRLKQGGCLVYKDVEIDITTSDFWALYNWKGSETTADVYRRALSECQGLDSQRVKVAVDNPYEQIRLEAEYVDSRLDALLEFVALQQQMITTFLVEKSGLRDYFKSCLRRERFSAKTEQGIQQALSSPDASMVYFLATENFSDDPSKDVVKRLNCQREHGYRYLEMCERAKFLWLATLGEYHEEGERHDFRWGDIHLPHPEGIGFSGYSTLMSDGSGRRNFHLGGGESPFRYYIDVLQNIVALPWTPWGGSDLASKMREMMKGRVKNGETMPAWLYVEEPFDFSLEIKGLIKKAQPYIVVKMLWSNDVRPTGKKPSGRSDTRGDDSKQLR